MRWLPNILSGFRLLAGFPICYFEFQNRLMSALLLIILGFLSDLIDGPIARKFKTETKGGKILDLSADICMDELIIAGLLISGRIYWQFAILLGIAIIVIRFPVIFSRPFLMKLGFFAIPFYGGSMIWLIASVAKDAVGIQIFRRLMAIACIVSIAVIWLKKSRIISDIKKLKGLL